MGFLIDVVNAGLASCCRLCVGDRADGHSVVVGAGDSIPFVNGSHVVDTGCSALPNEPVPVFARARRTRHAGNGLL